MPALTDRPLFAGKQRLDVSPERFGWLRESQAERDRPDVLRRRMEEEGYLFIRNFFPREEVQRVRHEVLVEFAREGWLDPSQPIESGIHREDISSYFRPDMATKTRRMTELLYSPEIMRFYSDLFGEPAMHYDYTWFRAVTHGNGTMPHCDVVYMGRGSRRVCTAWVPFGDVPLEVGGLVIVEGSHRWRELDGYRSLDVDTACENLPGKSQPEAHGHAGFGVFEPEITAVGARFSARLLTCPEYRMGDLLTFRIDLLHGSLDNQTNQLRISSDTRYQPASEPADERWIGETPPGHGGAMVKPMIC
ncbi:MAG: phytanoyl-CoA dioxygenase family protein [Fimbriimonadaceae bacterium]|nr:phytanoyl-CoA dioxygenase family protein [Fimbriimonadaceae bacterium]